MNYSPNDVLDRVKEACAENRVQHTDLLRSTGMSKNTFTNMRTCFLRCDNLAKIADYLCVSVDSLLGRWQFASLEKGAKSGVFELSEEEQELITYYRDSSKKVQRRILVYADTEHEADKKDSVENHTA